MKKSFLLKEIRSYINFINIQIQIIADKTVIRLIWKIITFRNVDVMS